MRGTVAKRLRRMAEAKTVGRHRAVTRRTYKQHKREYKRAAARQGG